LRLARLWAWNDVRDAFAVTVTTDYTSLFGGVPVTQSAESLVAGWKSLLPGFDATQHLLGPFEVRAISSGIQVTCPVRGYHRLAGAQGGDLWMVAGHYTILLARTDSAWRITHLTLHTAYQEGNPKLVEQAIARAKTNPTRAR